MKNIVTKLSIITCKINRQHIQVLFALLALTMLVLGAGAPDDGGSVAK